MSSLTTAPPELKTGLRLDARAFLDVYEEVTDRRAELIDGVVQMAAAARWKAHGNPQAQLTTWLGVYSAHTPGVSVAGEFTMELDEHNVYEPDAALIVDPECGGKAQLVDDYLVGPAELVAEVSASTVAIDLERKLPVYEAQGVQEYLVWRVLAGKLDWFRAVDGHFVRQEPDVDGWHRSTVFPGLWLDPTALVRKDLAGVLNVLDAGLESEAHTAFVASLQTE